MLIVSLSLLLNSASPQCTDMIYVSKCQVKVCWLSSISSLYLHLVQYMKITTLAVVHWLRWVDEDCIPFHISHVRQGMRVSLCCRVSHPASCFRMPPLDAGQTVSGGGTKHRWQAPGKAAVEENEQSLHRDRPEPQTCTHTHTHWTHIRI